MTADSNSQRGTLFAALVVAGAAVLYFAGLGDRALWSEEVRWAQIPREMVQTGDWFWPTINAHSYYDKPVGSYWLVLAAAQVVGGVNELAARLPSAAAGVLAVGLLIALTRRFVPDGRVAALSGAVLATSYGFVFFARTASTDVETIAGVLAALWIGTGGEGRWSLRRTLAVWLVMAITSLTKGLLGFALPLLVLGCYHTFAVSALSRPGVVGWVRAAISRNDWLLNPWTIVAAPLAAAVYFAPFAVSASQTGGEINGLEMVWRENIRRFFDAHNHRGPIYLYTYVIIGLLAPWSLLLPAGLLRAHQTRDRGDRFALAFFWAVFLFFTLSSSRRSYYLLPVLPAAAMLIARVVLAEAAELSPWTRRLRMAAYAITALGALGAGAVAVVPPETFGDRWAEFPGLPLPGLLFVVAVAMALGIGMVFAKFTPARAACALVVLAGVGMGYGYLAAMPGLEAYRTTRPFLSQVRDVTAEQPSGLALYRTRDAVWYLDAGRELPECGSAEEMAAGLEAGTIRWGLLKEQDCEAITRRVRVVLREPWYSWEGPDAHGRKMVLVEAMRP